MITFTPNPSADEIFTVGAKSWQWNGSAWVARRGVAVADISDAGAAFPAFAQAETAAAQREVMGALQSNAKSRIYAQQTYPSKWIYKRSRDAAKRLGVDSWFLNLVAFGDSLSENFSAPGTGFSAWESRFGRSGYVIGSGIGSGGVTLAGGASTVASDFDRWIRGSYEQIPSAGTVIYDNNQAAQIWCDTISVYYLKESGAGTFSVSTSLDGAAYLDQSGYTAVDTSNATPDGGVLSFSKTLGNYRVKITGVSGDVRILGVVFTSSQSPGCRVFRLAKGGSDYANWALTPTATLSTILTAIDPTLVYFCNTGATSVVNLDAFKARIDAVTTECDWVVNGVWPWPLSVSADGWTEQNAILRDWCADNMLTFWDPTSVWPTGEDLSSTGYWDSGVHPNAAANELGGQIICNSMCIAPAFLAPQRMPSGGWIFGDPLSPSSRWQNDLYSGGGFFQFGAPVVSMGTTAGIYAGDRVNTGGSEQLVIYRSADECFLSNSDNNTGVGFKWNSSYFNFYPLYDSRADLGKSDRPWGNIFLQKTVTAAGTTGAQTINKCSGRVNFAAAATSLVVTNSLVTAASQIIATVATNDGTMHSVQAVAAAGSFALYPNAAPTGETAVNFLITQ